MFRPNQLKILVKRGTQVTSSFGSKVGLFWDDRHEEEALYQQVLQQVKYN